LGFLPVYQRGFFCNDESLQYPYKDSTVSSLMLYSISLGLPILIILISEAIVYCRRKRYQLEYLSQNSFNRCCCDVRINPYFFQTSKAITMFLFGAVITINITDMAKNMIGRLRPHFMDVCQPDFSVINCSGGYITEFTCLFDNDDDYPLQDARRSFPSGHSSVSAYCMVYLLLYLESRMKWKRVRLLKPTLQFIAILLALFCCMSRISDYKHHSSDVFVGFILGTTVAVFMALVVANMFKKEEVNEKTDTINSEILFMEMNPRSRANFKQTISSSFI
uniref:Lipid phosphate phosphohydrolase 1-like n=1 Tax=Saccoglossus kowalevskii TaxID=10224 RepID=A0ABM0GST1_SACKO